MVFAVLHANTNKQITAVQDYLQNTFPKSMTLIFLTVSYQYFILFNFHILFYQQHLLRTYTNHVIIFTNLILSNINIYIKTLSLVPVVPCRCIYVCRKEDKL